MSPRHFAVREAVRACDHVEDPGPVGPFHTLPHVRHPTAVGGEARVAVGLGHQPEVLQGTVAAQEGERHVPARRLGLEQVGQEAAPGEGEVVHVREQHLRPAQRARRWVERGREDGTAVLVDQVPRRAPERPSRGAGDQRGRVPGLRVQGQDAVLLPGQAEPHQERGAPASPRDGLDRLEP